MEDLIRNFTSVKECFEKQSTEGLINSNANDLKRVCLKQRIDFVESLNKIDTKTISKFSH
jgi:L-cysteine desulfidase